MDRRRNGLIALVVLVTAVAALVYYDMRGPGPETTTAFAPAESADESVAPSDTPILPPADGVLVPDGSEDGTQAADAAAVDGAVEPETQAADGTDTLMEGEAEEPVADAAAPADDAVDAQAADAAAPVGDETDTAVADAPAAPQGVAEPVPETDVAMVDPSADVPPATATEPIVPPVDVAEPNTMPVAVPTFDVVRVEPSGDTVIAGQAEPNALIEIMDGPTVIATAEANDSGEWVIALDQPLDPGTHDLAISTTTADEAFVTLSDERVTVSVPEDGSTDVLVVLNAPDAPSTVLQVPPPALPADEPEVAVVEPPAAGEDMASAAETVTELAAGEVTEPAATAEATTTPDEPEVATAPESPAEDRPADVAMADGAPDAVALAAEEPAVSDAEQQIAMAPPAADTIDSAAGDTPLPAEPAIAAEEPVVLEPPVAAEPPVAPEADVAMAAPALEEPAASLPPPQPMVTVAAVEADTTGALYVAGVAATGETVRIYIDDEYIDDALPSPSGTWLVETIMDLPAGQYVVRVDQVAADGSVIARYEVPFDREVEVAILKPTGMTASADGATLAGAMPEVDTVIIKRGDNLWRIARATWGKGIRWSTIYQANTDQIRNPHRIYPGQVFVMPKGDATWQN